MNIFNFFKPKRKNQKKMDGLEPDIIKVSEDIQLTVKGLPPELPPEKRKAIFESLVRNTLSRLPDRAYDRGENLYQGQARLRINDEMYDIFFSLDAIRVLTALKIYKEAFDLINAGAKEGIYDRELAELTADYIKQSAWEEVQSIKSHKQPNVITQQVDENIEVVIEGIPQSVITPAIRADIVSRLAKENLTLNGNFASIILGNIKKTTLKIGNQSYEIRYVFRAR